MCLHSLFEGDSPCSPFIHTYRRVNHLFYGEFKFVRERSPLLRVNVQEGWMEGKLPLLRVNHLSKFEWRRVIHPQFTLPVHSPFKKGERSRKNLPVNKGEWRFYKLTLADYYFIYTETYHTIISWLWVLVFGIILGYCCTI